MLDAEPTEGTYRLLGPRRLTPEEWEAIRHRGWVNKPPVELPEADKEWGREKAQELMKLLIDYRRDLKIPAARVAGGMLLHPVNIYRLERNVYDPRLGTVLRYCRTLDLDLEIVRYKPQ